MRRGRRRKGKGGLTTRPVLERSSGNQSGQHWKVMEEKTERESTFLESGLKEGTSHLRDRRPLWGLLR